MNTMDELNKKIKRLQQAIRSVELRADHLHRDITHLRMQSYRPDRAKQKPYGGTVHHAR